MSWLILCPGCGVFLEIDDNGKSVPNAEYKFINDTICENCGRNMVDSLRRAVKEMIPDIIAEKTKYKKPPQS